VVVFSKHLLPTAALEALARRRGPMQPGAVVAAFDIQVEP
jgi:hypothetical protein